MKLGRRKRTRLTRHSRHKRRPAILKKLSALRHLWDVLDAATRGDALQELIRLGCSRRGLAQDIGVSATNVRFHLDLADLDPDQKEALKAGGSAKRAFVVLQQQHAMRVRKERIQEELMTSAVSDRLAKDIASFCIKPHGWRPDQRPVILCEGDIELFFVDLDRAIEMCLRGYDPMPPPSPKHLNFEAICQKFRPNPREFDFWFSWLAEWLAAAILSAAPDAIIREAARKKAPTVLTAMMRRQNGVLR